MKLIEYHKLSLVVVNYIFYTIRKGTDCATGINLLFR